MTLATQEDMGPSATCLLKAPEHPVQASEVPETTVPGREKPETDGEEEKQREIKHFTMNLLGEMTPSTAE